MKVGVCSLMFAVAMAVSCSAWAQERDPKKDDAKPAAKEEKKDSAKAAAKKEEKPAEKPTEKPAEQPPEKPATAAEFPAIYKKWNEVDKQLNELGEKYQIAPSSEERAVLRERYQKLVIESEKLLPQLRSSAEAAFEADPGKDPDVKKIMIGLMAYDFRRDEYEAVLKRGEKLLAAKVEEPAIYSIAGAAAYLADDYDAAEKYLPRADKAGRLDDEGKEYLKELPKTKELWGKEQAIRAKEMEADDLPRVKLETSKGTIILELFENEAPQTVGNFVHLVETKFYDNKAFHRVIAGFMAQAGSPTGDGIGGPGYEIPCECYRPDYRHHFRGSLSMAHLEARDTGGSQFFITFRPTANLDGKHTVFGRVIEGMEVLPNLQRRNPDLERTGAVFPVADKILSATIVRKREHEYAPTKVETKPPKTEPETGKAVPGKTIPKSIPKSGKAAGKK
jgi:cyclophilin family peptidyl-prolyl cis-trans isomerase